MSGLERERFIVRILDQNNSPVGAGFPISSRYVLTCFHVISKLGETITLDFPLLLQQQYKACIKQQFPLNEQAGPGDFEDIAILELLPNELLPDSTHPATIREIDNFFNHQIKVFGFPVGGNEGIWVDGKLQGRNAKGWIQIDLDQDKSRVESGFSGTAVWDTNAETVVGMVVSTKTRDNITTAYMIPASKLIKAWPELGKLTKTGDYDKLATERRPPPSLFSFLPYLSDRSQQAGELELTLDECEDSLHEKPLVSIIHGDEIECHDKFIKRLHEEILPHMLSEPGKVYVDLTMVEWPSMKDDIKMRCKKLTNNISKALTGNRRANAEEIKEALNRKISPQMVYFTLPVAAWEENEAELLKYWLRYWNEFPDLNDGRKLMVFLCMKYKHIDDNHAEGSENYKKKNAAARNFIQTLRYEEYANIAGLTLDELQAVAWSDVQLWITAHAEKFCNDTKLHARAREYYKNRDKVSMLELAEKLEQLLYETWRMEGSFV